MYVLCSLMVLTLHSFFKRWTNKAVEPGGRLGDGGLPEVWGTSRSGEDSVKVVDQRGAKRSYRAEGKRRRGGVCKRVQPVQHSNALHGPVVMFSTRKTWDLGHVPCLQELWKKDISLDASSVDLLMSDDEDEGSFLSLPTAAFSLTTELSETQAPSQLLIQALQDKVSRHLLLQQCSVQEEACLQTPHGVRVLQPGEPLSDRLRCPEEEQLVTRLCTQVEELEDKLSDQTQEVERLRSELGATDLEKQLELLVVENQRLKQELKSCRSSELQSLDAAAESCSHCPHRQDAESLQRQVSRWENQARQRERRLNELERELLEKSSRVESLHRQLDDGHRQLEESKRRQEEAELKLSLRLQEYEEELARQAAMPPRVKYVTQTVEVESADSQRALVELQTKNAGLSTRTCLCRASC